jgi:hypothetical protein
MKYMMSRMEYPIASHILFDIRLGCLYEYVSSSLLEWISGETEALNGWIVERYSSYDKEKVDAVFEKQHWVRVNEIHNDVVLLGRLRDDASTCVLLWFDCDVSDCKFMVFKTTDDNEVIMSNVEQWLRSIADPKPKLPHIEHHERMRGVFPISQERARRVCG